MDYWLESVSAAFDDAEIKASDEQIKLVAESIESSHENHDLFTGVEVANRNFQSDEAIALKELQAENEKKRIWELNTKPCKSCTTTGNVIDGWGRDMTCPDCQGKGRSKW